MSRCAVFEMLALSVGKAIIRRRAGARNAPVARRADFLAGLALAAWRAGPEGAVTYGERRDISLIMKGQMHYTDMYYFYRCWRRHVATGLESGENMAGSMSKKSSPQ